MSEVVKMHRIQKIIYVYIHIYIYIYIYIYFSDMKCSILALENMLIPNLIAVGNRRLFWLRMHMYKRDY